MSDAFGLIQKYTGISKYSRTEVVVLNSTAEEMVGTLPDDVFNPDAKFLDIALKSGRFLIAIHDRLMRSTSMKVAFPNEQDRHSHIVTQQLFGVATSKTAAIIARKAMYDDISCIGNIAVPDSKYTIKTVQGAFGNMKFDVVIGNPPYNNGMDLDFVKLGFEMCTKFCVMIVPGKWQTSDNQKPASIMTYDAFRTRIVPHMKLVSYYPDCLDVFGIQEASGITYYVLDKANEYAGCCTIKNSSKLQNAIDSTEVRDITKGQSLWNIGNEIIDYLGSYNKYELEEVTHRKAYAVCANTQINVSTTASNAWDFKRGGIKQAYIGNGGVLFNLAGNVRLLGKMRILGASEVSPSKASMDIFTADSKDECKSFRSWINTKFVRFFVLINIGSTTIINTNSFRFVPAPPSGKFDHIYTDKELYDAFNLPQKYRDVIEAVIRERELDDADK